MPSSHHSSSGWRQRVRRSRQVLLFLTLVVVALWGYANHRADHFTFDWTRPVRILLLLVIDPHTDFEEESRQGFLQRFLSSPSPSPDNLRGVESWFEEEYRKHTSETGAPLSFTARGPVRAGSPPPLPPLSEDPFFERWRETRDFLEFFEELARKEGLVRKAYDAAIFVYFYDETEAARYAGQHSVASRRNRLGVVFAPLGSQHLDRAAVLLAHEICHTLGATDKYREKLCVFPEGFADPEASPLYPQERGEIMGLGIPLAPGREARLSILSDAVIGSRTAEEIGWRRKP